MILAFLFKQAIWAFPLRPRWLAILRVGRRLVPLGRRALIAWEPAAVSNVTAPPCLFLNIFSLSAPCYRCCSSGGVPISRRARGPSRRSRKLPTRLKLPPRLKPFALLQPLPLPSWMRWRPLRMWHPCRSQPLRTPASSLPNRRNSITRNARSRSSAGARRPATIISLPQ